MFGRAVFLALVALFSTSSLIGQAAAQGVSSYYALLSSGGTISSSSGVHSGSNTATGTYTVNFNRPVTGCGYNAAVTGANAGYAVAQRTTTNDIQVLTYSTSGTLTNRQFTLLVFCAP